MGHKLIHHYFRIDAALVWDVVINRIPGMIEGLTNELPSAGTEPKSVEEHQ